MSFGGRLDTSKDTLKGDLLQNRLGWGHFILGFLWEGHYVCPRSVVSWYMGGGFSLGGLDHF